MHSPIDVTDLVTAADRRPGLPLGDASNRVMWLNHERVLYAGLLGDVSERTGGAWRLYVSLGDPIRVAVGAAALQPTLWALVPPYTPHRVACDERLIADYVIEPETIAPQALPADLLQAPPQQAHPVVQRMRELHAWMCTRGRERALSTSEVDAHLFGAPLPPRPLDARIRDLLQRIRQDPAAPWTAADCAARAGLSFSRFLHLFKQETGMSFRNLRAWKRARSLLMHVQSGDNLVHLALETGYPDSTHFSHSIRQMYGLRPRDIMAGSRRLTVLAASNL